MKYRWIMKNSNGTLWTTTGFYTHEEVSTWSNAVPIGRLDENSTR